MSRLACLAPLALATIAWADTGPAGVTLIVRGDPRTAARFEDAVRLADLHVDVRFAELPNTPAAATPSGSQEVVVAAARQDYGDANLRQCAARLAPAELLPDALREGQTALAARMLFWRAACLVGLGDLTAARAEARRLATLGLQIPADIGRTTPEVERVVADELEKAQRTARVPLAVDSTPTGASVSVDGRPRACVTPCSLEVLPGEHLVGMDADGWVSDSRTVRVEAGHPARASASLAPAAPELASVQWTTKYASSAEIDSANSVRLLARAVRARRLIFVSADSTQADARLRGAFADDQDIRGYAERYAPTHDFDSAAVGLMEDLLIKGSLLPPPAPLYRRPLFWAVVVAVAAAAVVGTYFAVSPPPVQTGVKF